MLVSKLDIMIPIQHILLVLLCYFICLHGPVNFMKVHFYKDQVQNGLFSNATNPNILPVNISFFAEMMNV